MEIISIQIFEKRYENEVISLISEIQQKEFLINITPEQQPDLKNIKSFYQNKNGNFWIAVHDEIVVGTIALLDIGNDEVALRKMFVKKEYRGKQGVAKKLLEEALTWAKAKKIKTIYLGTTSAFLAAHRFYEKNGFIEINKEDLPKSFPIMAVDSKFYCKHIF